MAPHVEEGGAAPVRSLPLRFQKNSYSYQQVERTDKTAIYAQMAAGKIVAFEAIKIRLRKAQRGLPGTKIRADGPEYEERYPGTNEWGARAWTFSLFGGKVSEAEALAQARAKLATVTREAPTESGNDPPEKDRALVAGNDAERVRDETGTGAKVGESTAGVNADFAPRNIESRRAR